MLGMLRGTLLGTLRVSEVSAPHSTRCLPLPTLSEARRERRRGAGGGVLTGHITS